MSTIFQRPKAKTNCSEGVEMKKLTRLVKYKTAIPQWEFDPVLRVLKSWCNKFHDTNVEIDYYTRTSTKIIKFFINTNYPESIDGYMLTGLILRMSEMNLNLEYIRHSERADDRQKKIINCFVLKFQGSSLGRHYTSSYCITNNISGHILFPPIITED